MRPPVVRKGGRLRVQIKMNRQLAGIGDTRLSPFSFAPLPFDRFALKQLQLQLILHGKKRFVNHLLAIL